MDRSSSSHSHNGAFGSGSGHFNPRRRIASGDTSSVTPASVGKLSLGDTNSFLSGTREGEEDEGSQNMILSERVDDYEPTYEEILEYARFIGMDPEVDADLLWVAEQGLKEPLDEEWKPCKTADEEKIYYFNFRTGESVWEHPSDEKFKALYQEEKDKRMVQREPSRVREDVERAGYKYIDG